MTTQSGRLPAFGLAIVLAIGGGLAWAALIGIGSAILDAVFFPALGRVTESLVVQRDGTPIIQAVVDDDWQNRTFRTLDGKPVVVAHLREQAAKWLLAPLRPPRRHANLSWERRVVMVGQVGGHDNWYIWHDGGPQGHAYLIGYDIRSKQKIGYIGRHGFRPDEPPPDEQFPVAGRKMLRWYTVFVGWNLDPVATNVEKLGTADIDLFDWHWFLADDGLLRINLKERTVDMVKKGGDLISATPFEKPITAETSSTKGRSMAALLVRTPDQILVMEFGTGKELASYPIAEKLRNADIHWYQHSPDRALIMSGYPGDELFWFDAAGKIVRHEHVDLKKPPPQIPKAVEDVEIALAGPSPAAIVGFLAYYPWNQNRPESMDYWPALAGALVDTRLIWLLASGISIVLACLCYVRQRKYGRPWSGVWTIFVLLFGLPAYLGYLAHCRWPARMPCPNCGQLAPRDRPACFACGREFPAPAPKGIEVFA